MRVLYCVLVVGYFAFSAGETIEVTAGEPFILSFGYSGPVLEVSHELTKDGKSIVGDNVRTFKQLGRLSFSEVLEEDSGEYRLKVTGSEINFDKTISLTVNNQDPEKTLADEGLLSPELAILKAIAEEHKESVKRSAESKVNFEVPSSKVYEAFRHGRIANPDVHHRGVARAKIENILERARRIANDSDFPPLSFEPAVSFAQCESPPVPDCSGPNINRYRTILGTCNNRNNPVQGAANTPFRRIMPAEYEDGIYIAKGTNQTICGVPFDPPWPSPRRITRLILRDMQDTTTVYNQLFTLYGQFLALDFAALASFLAAPCTCDVSDNLRFCLPILVEDEDADFGLGTQNNGSCLAVMRSTGECLTPRDTTLTTPRDQVNLPTHYLDMSGLYGTNENDARILRSFIGGRLIQGDRAGTTKGNLPFRLDSEFQPFRAFADIPLFRSGDVRVDNYVHQAIMYTLWLRQHNAIVDKLAKVNPCWDDERLYQEGRKIVNAIELIITYGEYLPFLFGNQFDTYVGGFTGYDPTVDATITHEFGVAAFRFGHSMVASNTRRLDVNGNELPIGPLGLREAFFNPDQYFISGGTDPLMRGMLGDVSLERDEFMTRILTAQLFQIGPLVGMDLASINIQRGRDHGIPSYRTYQRYCYEKFDIMTNFTNENTANLLRMVYGDYGYENGIDLWVGGLAEATIPDSTTNLSPTFACIIGETFQNLRSGDRFYWENPGIFTAAQQESLRGMTMSKVICNNADNIPNIKRNAFAVGGTPVSCDNLPSVDLSLWRDPNAQVCRGSAAATSSYQLLYLSIAFVLLLIMTM